ncbi:hypothetical protein RchiOBHm_Chr7g0234191 [Rosa chinensis]|uniref:Uncharacterized protein n=1 Tax=Rosa chinensis TaxID=74649 RepID=A0A2P6PGH0_ROSCH|nr:hypothetical protein RchiOBHm_Chr7g0234191 [Rosa chinensis]
MVPFRIFFFCLMPVHHLSCADPSFFLLIILSLLSFPRPHMKLLSSFQNHETASVN